MQNVIQARHLSKSFNEKHAVAAIDLAIPEGAIFGFLGPNGAGKTTTIKLLTGLLRPTGGDSSILGKDSWSQGDEVRKNIGVMFEDPGLYPWLNGYENIHIFGSLFGLDAKKIDVRIGELMPLLDLTENEGKLPVRKLSRGTKQKWGICRALLSRPRVLFLDEPTANLDPLAQKEVRNHILTLAREEQVTVFLNTHDLDDAVRLCSHIGIVSKGRLIACDTPQNLQPQTSEYSIEYQGEPLRSDELSGLPVKTETRKDGLLLVWAGSRDTVPLCVAYLAETKRKVFEVKRASNPLEDTFAELIREAEHESNTL